MGEPIYEGRILPATDLDTDAAPDALAFIGQREPETCETGDMWIDTSPT